MMRRLLWIAGAGLAALCAGCGGSRNHVVITSVSPSTLLQNGGAVTITGNYFTPDTNVNFGNISAVRVNVLSARTLTAVAPQVNSPQQVSVTVYNPENGSTTLANGFTYQSNGVTCAADGSCSYEADSPLNTLSGTASVVACSGCADGHGVSGIGGANGNTLLIGDIAVPVGGNYPVTVYGAVAGTGSFSMSVNGATPMTVALTGASNTSPVSSTVTVSLLQGTNTLLFGNANAAAPLLDHVLVSEVQAPQPVTSLTYLADAPQNTLSGSASVTSCPEPACPDGEMVGSLGDSANNYVTINDVQAPVTGTYKVTVYAATYADRSFTVSVNGGTPITLDIPGNNSSWTTPAPTSVLLNLNQGTNNSIQFGNPTDFAPNLVYITVPTTPN